MQWTREKLLALEPGERFKLYQNAKSKGAVDLIELITSSGVSLYDDKAVSNSSPIAMAIYDIAFSEAGTSAMRRAADDGLPPMAGLDPLLAARLGDSYGPDNQSTNYAGRIAAERMSMLGYKTTGRKAQLPTGSVAKSAEVMVRR